MLDTSALQVLDLEGLTKTMGSAPGFPHFCIDDFLGTAFADEVQAAFPDYQEAVSLGRAFSAVNERKKIQITDAALFPPPIHRLHEILSSDEFVAAMSRISGIPGLLADPQLAGGGIHETNQGGRLDVHVDFNYHEAARLHRRLNILVYFNKDWHAEWGGELELWDRDVKNCIGRFAPRFNRAVVFETSDISWHGVTPLTCPPEAIRKSFAAYYYTREAPAGWTGAKHSTIFKARPEEFWRGNVAMPAEDLMRATRTKMDSVKRGLRGLLGD